MICIIYIYMVSVSRMVQIPCSQLAGEDQLAVFESGKEGSWRFAPAEGTISQLTGA